ncbi:glycosyltransferase family 39 protein [Patescibacteria group bacterium]|nr:glycosyltransferase family 39 protein [Patescibacteria group bacterium]MCG2701945.1 glycosyltransferase family 39 protein [Candidatus Parcubacteria bacterium]MBU4265160.1 glycosyltransferase family 39 protein [Patescibacteria group bacterium]MBU4390724.1 glycosyltransferase family 39 protein [Patescibacteria group bacterium]MBU4397495.1 glycosyltransferase family 39 protein [Patescibacteria group bacterium]
MKKIHKQIIISILLIATYFLTRLQNLTSIPVFADEAIYIRWSQIIKNVETLRFIPLTDGKQPLFMWLTTPILSFFSDPLFAGRLLSVLAGLGTMVAIFLTTCLLSSKLPQRHPERACPEHSRRVEGSRWNQNPLIFILHTISTNFNSGLLSSLIYVFLPFSFFFDRLALPDTLLTMFGAWALYLSLLQSLFLRLDLSLVLGAILGAAWLTKSPAIFFIVLSIFTASTPVILSELALSIVEGSKDPKKNKSDVFKLLTLNLITLAIAFCIYNLLRLGPQFHMIAIRNKDYIWGLKEILNHPLDPLKPHVLDIWTIYKYFISLPVLLFTIISFILTLKKKNKTTLLLVTFWWILPLLANAIFTKVFTTRYILYTLPPLIIIISLLITPFLCHPKPNQSGKKSLRKKPVIASEAWQSRWIYIILLLIFLPNFYRLYQFSYQPFNLNLPSTETGYIQDWTSGWGIKQSADYLKQRAVQTNVIVGTEGYFGTLPDGLQIYTDQTPQLTVFGIGINIIEIPKKLIDAKNYGDEVYLLINQSRLKLPSTEFEKLKIVQQHPKPASDTLLLIKI